MIVLKADGSLAIHSDSGFKPLNYMRTGAGLVETVNDDGSIRWLAETSQERLVIDLSCVIADSSFELEAHDPGLIRDGTENHLQEWLADHPESLGQGWTLIEREARTSVGPVDLLCLSADGAMVAVEVKRTATSAAVDQVRRYVEAISEENPGVEVRGLVVAADVRPKACARAMKMGFTTVTLMPGCWSGSGHEEGGDAPILTEVSSSR